MLRQLQVRDFRSFAHLRWSVGPGFHLLLGGTGSGKTSLLEAVYAVATTRSFRTAQLADCVRRAALDHEAEDGFFLAAEAAGERRTRLELTWRRPHGAERRLDGERAPLAAHLGALPVLAWTSAEVEMVLGSPPARRRFLDRAVIYRRRSALQVFATYRRVLAHKRSLLRAGGSRAEISSWNALLAEPAAGISEWRRAFVASLREAFVDVALRSGLPYADVEIEYRASPESASAGPAAMAEAIEAELVREVASGRPLVGPHRDRLVLRWQGREIAQRASAGERKAIGLLLLAAQAKVLEGDGVAPLLLVDDADVELDRDTLRGVFSVLAPGPQTLASSNRPEVWEDLSPEFRWRVERGRIEEYKS